MKVAVIGVYCTKFGELWDKSLQDLLAEAELGALHDARIKPEQIDAIFTGNMCAGIFNGQLHLGAMAAEILNLNCPSNVSEAACASGGVALRNAILAIQSESAEVVMVNGVEKMTDLSTEQITTGLMAAASEEHEHFVGATFPALNALIARAYMHKHSLTQKQLAEVSVKNHKNAVHNPLAHFQKEITIDDVLNSAVVANPLTVLDCAPISDGAATLILSTPEFAKKYSKNPVYIIGHGQATDSLLLSKRESLTEFKATQIAAKTAYKMAKVTSQDIDIVELHDGFSICEIISLRDLGFLKKDKTMINNINPSGGLKAKGHPVGATGISQAYEIVMQLRNTAGARQIKNAKIGLTHNMGGCGSTSVVHIFSK